MRILHIVLPVGFLLCVATEARQAQTPVARPVPASLVEINDAFWTPRMDANRTKSIQHVFDRSQRNGGRAPAQLIEAAAYILPSHPDPELERQVEALIDRLSSNIPAQIDSREPAYRAQGTFLEAAVAYYQTTGKRKALDAAINAANVMVAAYGPGKQTYISGHEGLKIGLLSLYRETGDTRYRDLAQFFLDERGKDDYTRTGEYAIDRTYAQDHKPVIQQTEAVGHAVRATYLYIPLTDLAGLIGRPEYLRAADSIWNDAVSGKTYITGSIGSIRFHEQFGAPYELPNLSAWGETCASYGNVAWNRSMFLLHRDAQYVDQMERVLYNGFLDGVALDGDSFFYQNPLMSYGNYERFDWINTPCCPPNVVRLVASLGGYVYATAGDDVFVNLFVGGKARIPVTGGTTVLRQETRYPWEGQVRISVDAVPASSRPFTMAVRIPGWTGNQVMPGGLYQFVDRSREPVVLKVNGQTVNADVVKGFARITRAWKAGDAVDLTLPMPVRRVVADARVRDDAGRVAIERGPLVYAAEWPDNGGHALNIVVPDNARLASEFRSDLLGGVTVVTGRVQALNRRSTGAAAEMQSHQLIAIPYFAWANRGMGEMQVWLPRQRDLARVTPVALPGPIAAIRSSGGIEKKRTGYNDQNDDIAAVYDGVNPLSSADESNLYFRMRPPIGEPAWVEYDFAKPTTLSSTDVYFADDKRFCKLPASWRLVYKSGDQWKPVAAASTYGVVKDQFNRVAFAPITTTAVRIEIEPITRHYKSGEIGPPEAMFLSRDIDWREFGLIEWRVR